VRADPSLPPAVTTTQNWDTNPATGALDPALDRLTYYRGPDYHRHHYSGHERNKLFLNLEGRRFLDVSAVSGADSIADSRSWAAIDFDRDGFPDIAVVNANTPLLEFLKNNAKTLTNTPNRFLAVRLEGSNHAASRNPGSSPRTPVGATVTAHHPDVMAVTRTLAAGSGFAAQGSATLLFGLDGHPHADRITVRFPSGQVRELAGPFPAGTLVTVPEDPTQPHSRFPYTP